jgi:hypothetical protein
MIPDTDLQLAVVIKALQSTVASALEETNPLAREQCQLAVATLGFMRERLPRRRRMVRMELRNSLALAEQLNARQTNQDLVACITTADVALANAELDSTELEAVTASLNVVIAAGVEASPNDREMALLVISATQKQAELARAWFAPGGFELDPTALRPLDELLK